MYIHYNFSQCVVVQVVVVPTSTSLYPIGMYPFAQSVRVFLVNSCKNPICVVKSQREKPKMGILNFELVQKIEITFY